MSTMSPITYAEVSRAKQRRRLGLPEHDQGKGCLLYIIKSGQAQHRQNLRNNMGDGESLPGITDERDITYEPTN
jgi:hypothetical protein